MKCNVLTNFVAIFRKVITGAAQMDFFTTAAIVVVANYFDDGKCPRVLAGHVNFHFATVGGEIITLASVEMATQVDFLFLLILGSSVESEDFSSQAWVSPFQLRIWLGHKVTYFTILKSWVVSNLVSWMLFGRVTRLHVAVQMLGAFGHEATLTADEAATNVYITILSLISVTIEDTLSSSSVFLLELAERDDVE